MFKVALWFVARHVRERGNHSNGVLQVSWVQQVNRRHMSGMILLLAFCLRNIHKGKREDEITGQG